jgi:hypothetical protein
VAEVRVSPAALLASDGLEKAAALQKLDARRRVDLLEADPASAACRKRSFSGGLWGIPVRDRHDDWLIVWEHDRRERDIVRVPYVGADPFA